MTRNKAGLLGLAALAFVALSAFVVQGAQGEGKNNFEFTCIETEGETHENVACTGTGIQAKRHGSENSKHEFSTGIATLRCGVATFAIDTDGNGKSETAPTAPTYEECEDTLTGEKSTVTTNGCKYEFHAEEEVTAKTEGEDEFKGSVDVVCTGGNVIDVHLATGCTLTVPAQETIAPVYFRNMTAESPTDATVEAVNAEVHTIFHGGFFKCGKFANPATGFSKYNGNTTVRSFNEAGDPIDAQVK